MPVKMTREQYNTLYGVQPVFSSVSSLDTTPAPVRMTQSEYDALYRPKEATLLEKTGSVLKGETTSPAKLGGAETILPNITSYFKNIPSSAANLIRQTIAPINPLDTENPLNIGAALVRTKEAYKNDLQSGTPIAEAQKNIILSPLKGAFSMWKGAGESIYKNLEQNALASKTLSGGVALSAAAATSKIAEMIINDPTLVPALLWAPEAVGAKADAISKTARPFIEAGTAGARAFEPVVARASKLAEPVVSKLPKVGLPAVTAEARLENTISKIEQELFKIENNYSTTRKANDFVSDAGAASRRRIASTDVLVGAVDNNGILRTKGAGSAIEKYRAQTIDGIESVVRDNLFREGKTANIAEFGNKLKLAVYDSGLEGSDLVKALDGIKRELQGLALRADEFGNLPLYRYHDAKIATTNGINYLSDSKPTVFYRKAKARAYKEFVEEKSTFNVKAVNQQLKKYYEDIALLERLDGKRVEGGRLGKYFASISGNIIGGATGAAVGGYAGAAVGSVLGGEAAQLIKGGIMSRTFGKARGLVAPENSILAEAKQTAKLKPSVDLRVPDKAVGALKNVPKTKEILSIEKKIKDNVRQQLAAIKAGDFTLVAALKEIYTALVDKLKKEIKIAQSYSLGSRKTQYSAKAATSKKLIESNVASKTEKVNETDFLKREAAYSKMEQKQFEANSKIIDEYISMTDAQKTAFENALTEGEIDKLKMESAVIEEVIANSPEKELQKYATVTMVDGKPAKAQLPEVGRSATDANGKYRLNGDEIANNLGYEDTKAAQDALERFVLVQRRRDNINDMLKKQREVKKTMKNDTATQDLPQDSRAALGLSTQNLINEAKKYKSAEEFVEASGKVKNTYSNTDWQLKRNAFIEKYPNVAQKSPAEMEWIEAEKIFVQGKLAQPGEFQNALKEFEDVQTKFSIGDKEWSAAARKVDKLDKQADREIGELLAGAKKGDTTAISKLDEYRGDISTKSQLTDIWNKAHGK